MRHNHIATGGHWGASPSSDGVNLLVQIGDVDWTNQTRLVIAPEIALHMAGDLVAASKAGRTALGPVHIGERGSTWSIVAHADACTLTLVDEQHVADRETTVTMTSDDMRAMAKTVARLASDIIPEDRAVR